MPFPTLTLLDSFKRAESPLSNGGKWQAFFLINGNTGSCVENIDWEHAEGIAGKTYGAYWTPEEFTNPGIAITRDRRIVDQGEWSIWGCLSEPLVANISGYRLQFTKTGEVLSRGEFIVRLERCDKNVFTTLSTTANELYEEGDSVGLLIAEGKVEYWHKPKGGAWEKRASAADATYTKGFVGFSAKSANGDTTNFEAANSGPTTPSVENPGTQFNRILKEVSLQIHTKNVTVYKATGLPKGLAINESTGLITGEPTTVENPLVKIKVENVAKEVAETSFEWVVYKQANVINMVVS